MLLLFAVVAVTAAHAAQPRSLLAPSPPPPSWKHTNCSSCLGAGLLWCYLDDKCWTHFDPKDRGTQSCKLNLEWCAAGSECGCTTCGDAKCQTPAPAPNPLPTPTRVGGVQQVHLALGKTAGTMTVAWTTMNATGSAAVSGVRYGPTTAADNIVNANDNNGGDFGAALPAYVAGDTRLLNVSGTRYTHVATMDGLVPGRAYTYQVDGDSTTFNFTFRRQGGAGGRTGPDRHIIFGDLGASHAFSICDACTAGADNCEASACVANRSAGLVAEIATADMMLHVGDFAYDFDGNGGLRGDQFMRNIEQVAAHVPYMVSHGNHEDSDANLAHYIERFRSMPSNGIPSTVDTVAGAGVNTLWYSWDAGLVHYVAIDTEIWDKSRSQGNVSRAAMLAWLRTDLTKAQANRANVPWIVCHGHQSVYCSTGDDGDCNLPGGPAWNYRLLLEPLFFEFGVDFWMNGHEHSYERSYPVYKGKSDRSNLEPKATIYVVTGAAGCAEMHEGFTRVAPSWSAFRSNTFGYSRMTVYNASHLHWQQVQTDPTLFGKDLYGRVIDDAWIVQHNHGPFSLAAAPTGTAWPIGDEHPSRSHEHWDAMLGLADGSGRATTALIREFIAEHGEAAFAAKEDALLAMAKRYAGAGSSTVWEDVRDDGSSEGAWFNQFKWRGADGRTQ